MDQEGLTANHQGISRYCTRGESEESFQVQDLPWFWMKGIRHHQESKTGPTKSIYLRPFLNDIISMVIFIVNCDGTIIYCN